MLRIFRRFTSTCHGCGILLQHTQPEAPGYIPLHKYTNLLTQNQKIQQSEASFSLKQFARTFRDKYEEVKDDRSVKFYTREKLARKARQELKEERHQVRLQVKQDKFQAEPHFIDANSVSQVEEIGAEAVPLTQFARPAKPKPVICMRCFKLSKYGTPAVCPHTDPRTVLQLIFGDMKKDSVILMVIDLLDFNGSFIKEIYDEALKKNAYIVLVANKVDALPKNASFKRIHSWVKHQVQGMFVDQNIAVVSSKTGEGFGRLLHLLRTLKNDRPKADFYVVGSTNSGKSSFLNKLARRTWNLPEGDFRNPILVNELTTSNVPGTTIEKVPVSCRSLKLTVYDTPGIPTISQYTLYADPISLKALIPGKKIKPLVLISHPGQCFWLGSLARIEMISGEFQYLTFFVSHLVSVHKTRVDLAEDVYNRQSGKLLVPKIEQFRIEDFRKEVVQVKPNKGDKAVVDLVFHGLGWVSVTGVGNAEFHVYLPKTIGFTSREPLMPYEMTHEKVQKHKSKTYHIEHWHRAFKN